jgi:tRNA pseudouridine55 synthase
MDGFIVVNKPSGITSHDVVSSVRRILRLKKVGHTGTLDPFATGVLPIATGEATKAINFLDESKKEYLAVMHLGISTNTQDHTGEIISKEEYRHISHDEMEKVFSSFLGTTKQIPPMFSAVKQSGIPLYKLAREGIDVHREPREIHIFSLNIEKIDLPRISFRVRCSRGTYVRTLANDLGKKLGCGAHLTALQRTMSGLFTLDQSISLETLASLKDESQLAEVITSPFLSLSHLRDMPMTQRGVMKVRQGIIPMKDDFQEFPDEGFLTGERVMLSYESRLIAVAENKCHLWSEKAKNMRLLRVFN